MERITYGDEACGRAESSVRDDINQINHEGKGDLTKLEVLCKWRSAIQVSSENDDWHSPVLILYSIKVLTSESALQHVSLRNNIISDEIYRGWLTTWRLCGYDPTTYIERPSRSRRQWHYRLARYRRATLCRWLSESLFSNKTAYWRIRGIVLSTIRRWT